MIEAFEQYFKLQGAEFSTEWKSILREIKTTTYYDVFNDKLDANLDLLSSIIKEYGFLQLLGEKAHLFQGWDESV
jgi:hypothetical protein